MILLPQTFTSRPSFKSLSLLILCNWNYVATVQEGFLFSFNMRAHLRLRQQEACWGGVGGGVKEQMVEISFLERGEGQVMHHILSHARERLTTTLDVGPMR